MGRVGQYIVEMIVRFLLVCIATGPAWRRLILEILIRVAVSTVALLGFALLAPITVALFAVALSLFAGAFICGVWFDLRPHLPRMR